ncbi:MAG: site-specific integrase, partial [Dysgonamonadaceae bacterium]|nr:site-specific integrase [Dysgonamonadaceae bacterium]
YMDENPFSDFKIKRGSPSYTYLTEDELKIFMEAYKNGVFESKYHTTLEFFLFMCFSSLHVTDAKNMSLEQFTQESFIYYRVKNRNSKPEPIMVPVSEPLRIIVKNIVGTRKKGKIFHNLPADQTMNRYLKDIAAELEVKKKITHKSGRHTFATYFLAKSKDITALQEILGHSSLSETMIYAHVLDESKQDGVKYFNDLL